MLIVRDIFHYTYGADEIPGRFKELVVKIQKLKCSATKPRLLLDFTGNFNTLSLETSHKSLAQYEESLEK
jgi:hypothetical protein